MNVEYTVGMAILDFVPKSAFLIGALFLVRIAAMAQINRCSRSMW